VGQTKRRLRTRINEHRSDINKRIEFLSVISDHCTSFIKMISSGEKSKYWIMSLIIKKELFLK